MNESEKRQALNNVIQARNMCRDMLFTRIGNEADTRSLLLATTRAVEAAWPPPKHVLPAPDSDSRALVNYFADLPAMQVYFEVFSRDVIMLAVCATLGSVLELMETNECTL